jgi:hypothetical protein
MNNIDGDQIKKFWECVNFNCKNHIFQCFPKDKKQPTNMNDVITIEDLTKYCNGYHSFGLSCLSINPILLGGTNSTMVTEIENIWTDIDVKNKVNGVSTAEDKQHALEMVKKCITKLQELGFVHSLLVDSGNGYHIYVPVLISLDGINDTKDIWDISDTKGRLITIEKELQKFNDDIVQIDGISKDIFRRAKIPGTLNVKKEISPENYRMCSIIEATVPTSDIITKNTEAFNKLKPTRENIATTSLDNVPDKLEWIITNDAVFREMFMGDWKKYCYKEDGTKKEKWSRSEAEAKLVTMMFRKGFTEKDVRAAMKHCKVGKWQQDGKSYQDLTIKKSKRWANVSEKDDEEKQIQELMKKGMDREAAWLHVQERQLEKEAKVKLEGGGDGGDGGVGDDDININKSEIIEKFFSSKEERDKLKIIHNLSDIIYVNHKPTAYSVVFSCKDGIYHPLVVFDNRDIVDVRDKYVELLQQGKDKKEISKHDRYQYFIYGGVKYKFAFRVSWNYKININRVDETGVENFINDVPVGKDVFDKLKNNLTQYWNYPEALEYWITCTHVVMSYIDQLIGQTFFLVPFGKQGSGKSTLILWLSYVYKNGFYSGKISIASSVRFIERYGIALCYDEFEKKRKEEKLEFIGVTNNSYTKEGIYVVQKQNSKSDDDDTNVFKTFCTKAFTANTLSGFDISFIDRCHCIIAAKNLVSVKNIHRLSNEEFHNLQTLRNSVFSYTVCNWFSILEEIEKAKQVLDKERLFGREGDKISFIVGIIRHFKGDVLASQVKQYLLDKAKIELEEKTKTIEEIVLELLVEECENQSGKIISILNKTIRDLVCEKLNVGEEEAKKISYQRIKRIVANLNLIPKKSNISSIQGGAVKFLILKDDILDCLRREGYKDLEIRMLNLSSPSPPSSPSSPTSKTLISKEDKEKHILNKGRKVTHSIKNDPSYDFCCDTENLQIAIDIVQENYDVLTDTKICDMIKSQILSSEVSEKELVAFVGEIYEIVVDALGG